MTPRTSSTSRPGIVLVLGLLVVSLAACRAGSEAEDSGSTTTVPADSPTNTSTSTTTTSTTAVPTATNPASRTLVVPGDVLAVESAAAAPPTAVDGSVVTPDGRTRTYHLYVPDGVAANTEATVPLLLAFHGGSGSGNQYQRNAGFAELAETNGFIVAYPDGVGAGPDETLIRTWNAGICCGAAARGEVDDVTFARMLIDQIESEYPIDPDRVFAAGHSNGAMISYRLACELSDRIAAIAVQAGTMAPDGCNPSEPVSVLHIHGTDDTNVPIDGGIGADSVAGVDFPPPMGAVETLATADGCATDPEETTSSENPDVTVTRWTGCTSGAAVAFLAVDGADHGWMGHNTGTRRGGTVYPDLDSSATAWNFLIQHPRS